MDFSQVFRGVYSKKHTSRTPPLLTFFSYQGTITICAAPGTAKMAKASAKELSQLWGGSRQSCWYVGSMSGMLDPCLVCWIHVWYVGSMSGMLDPCLVCWIHVWYVGSMPGIFADP